MRNRLKKIFNPEKDPKIQASFEAQKQNLPTLWLLGKTGAGKSSLIQFLTQGSDSSPLEIGNGFMPCTKTAQAYDFPQDMPLFRFLDTRGLGEADYDPTEDIAACQGQSHALIVLAKADEMDQSPVIAALKKIKKSKQIKQVFVVHTGLLMQSEDAGKRGANYHQEAFEKAWGDTLESVELDFLLPAPDGYQTDQLIDKLMAFLPIVGMALQENEDSTQEEASFSKHEKEILWYAGSASASDLVPAVGLVSVPAIQGKMLHSLANYYGIEWDKKAFSKFAATLGTSFGLQYGVKLGMRQLVKFIPVYGQSIGAVTAAVMSFATTYGLGRAGCYYFYQLQKGDPVTQEDLEQIYQEAFLRAKKLKDAQQKNLNNANKE